MRAVQVSHAKNSTSQAMYQLDLGICGLDPTIQPNNLSSTPICFPPVSLRFTISMNHGRRKEKVPPQWFLAEAEGSPVAQR